MSVEQFYPQWLLVFKAAGLENVSREEFNEWAAGLDGELNNEYTQNNYSVMVAAEEAISELSDCDSGKEIKNCKCGGEAIVEDGFIDELNSSGKFVCCLECPKQTKVYLDHEEAKALDDWENDKLDAQAA